MKCFVKLSFVVTSLSITTPMRAAENWGIGLETLPQSQGLTIQRQIDPYQATNLSLHVFQKLRSGMGLDYQRFLFSQAAILNGPNYRGAVYTGAGLWAAIASKDAQKEILYLNIPLGLQISVPNYHAQIFVQADGLIGSLPHTQFKPNARLGARLTF